MYCAWVVMECLQMVNPPPFPAPATSSFHSWADRLVYAPQDPPKGGLTNGNNVITAIYLLNRCVSRLFICHSYK